MMDDTITYYQLIQQSLADSTLRGNILEGRFIGTFLQNGPNPISPLSTSTLSTDYITYILLFFITGMAFIWNYLPERLSMVFSFSVKKGFSRPGEVTFRTPGILISLFFFLNYLFSLSFLIFITIRVFVPDMISGLYDLGVIALILAVIFLFYMFRISYIKISGIIFKTEEKATQQLNLYINTENALGVLLIPVVLISLFGSLNYILFAGLLIYVIFHLIRWIKTFLIGMSVQGFSVLHLILYLCTLEIIPVLIIIKLVENGRIY